MLAAVLQRDEIGRQQQRQSGAQLQDALRNVAGAHQGQQQLRGEAARLKRERDHLLAAVYQRDEVGRQQQQQAAAQLDDALRDGRLTHQNYIRQLREMRQRLADLKMRKQKTRVITRPCECPHQRYRQGRVRPACPW